MIVQCFQGEAAIAIYVPTHPLQNGVDADYSYIPTAYWTCIYDITYTKLESLLQSHSYLILEAHFLDNSVSRTEQSTQIIQNVFLHFTNSWQSDLEDI